jgi:hypothetical protein
LKTETEKFMTVTEIKRRADLIADAAAQGINKSQISMLIVGLLAEQAMDHNLPWVEDVEVKTSTTGYGETIEM